MTDTADWQNLASALRELHRALMECARQDYEREHKLTLNPVEQLRLLTADPFFDWLHGLSELMVDIDLVHDAEPPALAEIAPAVRAPSSTLSRHPSRPSPATRLRSIIGLTCSTILMSRWRTQA